MPTADMPVLLDRKERQRRPDCPKSVPMSFLDERQADINHQQTLGVLASRGGLCPSEMLAVMERRRWKSMDFDAAVDQLKAKLVTHD